MTLLTRLRASSALWAAPVALGLVLLYFFGAFAENFRYVAGQPDYAPMVASYALTNIYALLYATASCLAAWESGRLKRDGVWQLAPARSRMRIAAQALLPVLGLAWAMALLPVAMALIREGVAPTPGSAILPLLAMTVACAHLAIGFAVGLVVPRLFATPVLALVVFYAVAVSWSQEPFWHRHVSGQFPVDLGYAELPTPEALVPHVLFAGTIALGAILLCLPLRRPLLRAAVALAAVGIALAGTLTARGIVEDWGPVPPLSTGNVAVECMGRTPRICLPAGAAADESAIAAHVTDVFEGLRHAGVPVRAPETITDSMLRWREAPASTESEWWVPLTESFGDDRLALALVSRVVDFPCRDADADPVAGRSAMLWAAGAVGADQAYLEWQRGEVQQFGDGQELLEQVVSRVAEVRTLPAAEQADWYAAETERACRSGGDAP
ncbi:hypothetical protein RM780_16805 [Streptomyces sp. DSM 44917]|uniref:DUF7224 domain-containing protein n=1 Tax=Streptomyces boetiae TaxID=3075541 RepID=A0ABU2LAW7_9ACTN|nr:hypothetical protein [Streptomyces sp. DSM 44917]MDT0308606.1 hypothetical protein [Streptomyces sp. DSM 44917]